MNVLSKKGQMTNRQQPRKVALERLKKIIEYLRREGRTQPTKWP